MKNIFNANENLVLVDENDTIRYEFTITDLGRIYERTYNKEGNELTYRTSDDFYEIKGNVVTKEEFESFKNGTIN